MTCVRIQKGIICGIPNEFVNLEPFGANVWCEMHSYFGPSFFRSEKAIIEIRMPSKKTWAAYEAWQKSKKDAA